MFNRILISKIVPVFIILMSLFTGVIPTQSESLTNQPNNSGDLFWAKGIGGAYYDIANAITVDSDGNVYITGGFRGTVDFDPGAGIFNLSCGILYDDIFVLKMDSSGNFVWAKRMGGLHDDMGYGIAVDSNGYVYTVGSFESNSYFFADFDPGSGKYILVGAGGVDIFVSKLDSNGDFVWAKSLGGGDYDEGYGIALDSSGNIYTTGYFRNTADFDPGTGTHNLTSAGYDDIFVSKLDNGGNFIWAKQLGGPNEYSAYSDEGHGIAVDTSGNVYTTGSFVNTADFDPGADKFDLISVGSSDIFISKLDSNGDFVWAKGMGGTEPDEGQGIVLDSNGDVFTTGYFRVTADFDPGTGTYNLTSAGYGDIFVSKLDGNGGFVWARNMGGSDRDEGMSITIDSMGNVYTTGLINDTADLDPGTGTFYLTDARIFVSKLDSNGDFAGAINMGGVSVYDLGCGIAVDSSGNVHTTGSYWGTNDFDPGEGIFNLTSAGKSDIFVSKIEINFVRYMNYLPVILGNK